MPLWRKDCFWVMLACLAVRGGFALSADTLPTRPPFDGYLEIATNLLQGGGFGPVPTRLFHLRTPVYPLFLAGLWSGAPEGCRFQILAAAQVVLSAATCGLLWAMVRPVFGRGAAAASGLMFAASPSLTVLTTQVYTETLQFFLLTLAGITAARVVRRGRGADALAFGLLWGVLGMNRPEATYVTPVLLAPLLLNRAVGLRRTALALAVALLANAAVMAPWVVRNYRVYGAFVTHVPAAGSGIYGGSFPYPPMYGRCWAKTPAGDVAYWQMPQYRELLADFWDPVAMATRPDWADEIVARSERDFLAIDRRLGAEAKRQIAANPRLYAWNLAAHAVDLWGRPVGWSITKAGRAARAVWSVSYVALLGLAAAGTVLVVRHGRRIDLVALGWVAYPFWHTLVMLPINTECRYQAASVPFLLALAGCGAAAVASRRLKMPYPRAARAVETSLAPALTV